MAYIAANLHRHEYAKKPALQIGSTTLHWLGGSGKPILFVPSHINRGYILAVDKNNSLAYQLVNAGYATYILEWNSPDDVEMHFNLQEYITERLLPAMQYIQAKHGKMVVAGYCMGGLLALASAQLYPDMVAGLVTIATPFDFNQRRFPYVAPNADSIANLNESITAQPISSAAIHMMMQMPQVYNTNRKLIALGRKLIASDTNPISIDKVFTTVETWAVDGIDMSWPVFKSCVQDWLQENAPYRKSWVISGQVINPAIVPAPSFSAIALDDDIVPFSSALPLSSALPNNKLVYKQTGHLGLILSRKAGVGPELLTWLRSALL
ncbi:MAG: alpha/beta hydrolase [Proteobacteria bacterium]|nr:alpha/beta hydrolase [Pseudomonadota bacterium]